MSEETGVEQESPVVPPTATSCRDCALALYDGSTQEGCALGRVDAFERAGAVITGYDDGERKFLTFNRVCNTFLPPERAAKWGGTMLSLAVTARDLVRVRIGYIIYVAGPQDLEGVKLSVLTAKDQSPPPATVAVAIAAGASLSPTDVVSVLRDADLPCEWQVVRLNDWDEKTREAYGNSFFGYAVDEVVRKLDPQAVTYYAAAWAGEGWSTQFASLIDGAVNDRMLPVVAATGGNNLYAVQTAFHSHLLVLGNLGYHILKKIPEILRDYPGPVVLDLDEEDSCDVP